MTTRGQRLTSLRPNGLWPPDGFSFMGSFARAIIASIGVREWLLRNLFAQKPAKITPAVTSLPIHHEQSLRAALEIGRHIGIVFLVPFDQCGFGHVREGQSIKDSAYLIEFFGILTLAAQHVFVTAEPFAGFPLRQNKSALRKGEIKLLIHQNPGPVFEGFFLIRQRHDSGEITGCEVFHQLQFLALVVEAQHFKTPAQGGGPSLGPPYAKNLAHRPHQSDIIPDSIKIVEDFRRKEVIYSSWA